MSDYIPVPVPTHLVMEVMRLITASDAAGQASPTIEGVASHALMQDEASDSSLPTYGSDTPSDALGEDMEARRWSREELQFIWDQRSGFTSVDKFCRMLTLLASASPHLVDKEAIGDHFGEDFRKIQNGFGPFSRFLQKRLGDNRWPLRFSPDGRAWGIYDDETARDWRSIVEADVAI